LPDLYTSNGFCICSLKPEACVREQHESCGVRDTVKSLWDETLRKVEHLKLSTSCSEQFDWPYFGGTMRDGTVSVGFAPQTAQGTCDVTDRLPVFKYRYVSNGTITSQSKTSLHKGGACHMGTAPTYIPTEPDEYITTVCRKKNETHSNITILCYPPGDYPVVEITMNKTLSKSPQWGIDAMKKTR
jgi:hypothetical protein